MLRYLRTCRRILRCCPKNKYYRYPSSTFTKFFCNNANFKRDDYTQIQWYRECEKDSVAFWRNAAKEIEWDQFPTTIYKPHDSNSQLNYSWFSDGKLNITISMIDRHIKNGNGNNIAIIYDSPVTSHLNDKYYTYNELLELVENCASYLTNRGIQKGDRVLIYMPQIPEALIAMYASARIGAIHSVVFGGFAGNELSKRIIDCKPQIIITTSGGKEGLNKIIQYQPMVNDAISLCPDNCKPKYVLIKQRYDVCIADTTTSRDEPNVIVEDWDEQIINSKYDRKDGRAVIMNATDPLYILYTSGTTGTPKGIIRECGGYAVALNWTMNHFYGGNSNPDPDKSDVIMAGSDIGWVVGHSYIAYSQLLNGSTTILFEGKPIGTPDAATYWRLIQEHNIKSLFIAPTALRAIRKEDPNGNLLKNYNISCLQNFFLAGERCDPNTMQWISNLLNDELKYNTKITDHWWQTETGWPITGVMCGDNISKQLPMILGSGGSPIPGMMLSVVPPLTTSSDDDNELKSMQSALIHEVDPLETGELVLKLPLPPGTLGGIWNNPSRTFTAYLERYPGYYCTGDTGYRDDNGFIHIMSRVDDLINVSGHRLSTASMEQVLAEHTAIAECAVIGVQDILKGEIPIGIIVKKEGFNNIHHKQIEEETINMIRNSIGAVASYKETIVVDKLPKTRSGKILRRSLKDIYNTEKINDIPATIEDVDALDHFKTVLLKKREKRDFSKM